MDQIEMRSPCCATRPRTLQVLALMLLALLLAPLNSVWGQDSATADVSASSPALFGVEGATQRPRVEQDTDAAAATAAAAPGVVAIAAERVQIIEPYIELHSGPGRGFPVFDVVKRGGWLTLLKRRTDWFEVRSDEGKQGWVDRQQISATLTQAGQPKTLRDVVMDDYIARRLEIGIVGGRMEGDPMLGLRADYRLHDYFAAELALTQVTGTYNTSRLFAAEILGQPFPRWRFAPFFTLGIGRFNDTPRRTLVDPSSTDATTGIAGAGARLYFSQRFLLRLDYRNLVVLVDDDRTRAFDEFSAGLSFFF
jgi:uncharacterized protein YraI